MNKDSFYIKYKELFDLFNGIFLENSVLVTGAILAPVVVVSTSYENSFILACAFSIITFFTVLLSSFVPRTIPVAIRSIIYTLIACLIFIPTSALFERYYSDTLNKLGVFVPLLVTNSLIVVKSESHFHKMKKGRMAFELFCHMVGFYWVIILIGSVREIMAGTFNGVPLNNFVSIKTASLPFVGFILTGMLASIVQLIRCNLMLVDEEAPTTSHYADVISTKINNQSDPQAEEEDDNQEQPNDTQPTDDTDETQPTE